MADADIDENMDEKPETDVTDRLPADHDTKDEEHEVGSRLAVRQVLSGRRATLLAAVVSAFLGIITFAPALDNDFVYDDLPIIVGNPSVTEPGPWYRFWLEPYWPRAHGLDRLYRPLTVWSFRMNAAWTAPDPLNPWSFHLVNLIVHALASAAVAVLACRLTGRVTAGWIAGVLFATHPVHTEAVVTGYGRSELLAGFFSAWLLARHIRPMDADRPHRVRSCAASALLLLAAVMSKEHAAFVWPALLLIDLWRRHMTAGNAAAARLPTREWFNRILAPSHIGFALACTTFLLFRVAVFGHRLRLENWRVRAWESPMAHASLIEHVLTPFRLLWLTLETLIFPQRLCPTWSIPALSPADKLAGDVIAGMVLMAAMIGLVVLLWRRRSLAGAIVAGMLLVLAMPIQALPLAHWFFAERWLYLPTVFIAVLMAAALCRWGANAVAVALAVALILLPQSWQYSSKFANNETMHREVIRRQPDSFHGWRNLASVLYFEARYSEAVQAANELIERFGPVTDAYAVLLKSYLELGDGRRALDAINQYEYLRRHLPAPSLSAERQRAQMLIDRQRRSTAGSAPASATGGCNTKPSLKPSSKPSSYALSPPQK